jgi:osmoprotectant transport system permease protein
MRNPWRWIASLALLVQVPVATAQIAVGSKNFTEGYVLAEVMSQLLEARGLAVERRFGFGGTMICFQALLNDEIQVYPEYTGTLREAVYQGLGVEAAALQIRLAKDGLETLPSLGFNNSYAIAIRRELAQREGLKNIGDLAKHPALRIAVSHEFRERSDGWGGLKLRYGLPQDSTGIEHGLAYQALAEGKIDVTDAYTTDGDILRYDLVVLEDHLDYFPDYLAVPLIRSDLPPAARSALQELAGTLSDNAMRQLNARVLNDGLTIVAAAEEFLQQRQLIQPQERQQQGLLVNTLGRTAQHLKLTGIALLAACVIGIGLALAVFRSRRWSQVVLYVAGLLQTIPSIALLALLIPLVGIGQVPAVIALFLYSLLPILRNTVTALTTIDPLLRHVAHALGLNGKQRLRKIYLPLAAPHIIAGLRIAAVVSIGTATLAAFIGAGGLGEPIVTGLALNDTRLILEGAVPAAGLAVVTELLFEAAERWLIPAHLLNRQAAG